MQHKIVLFCGHRGAGKGMLVSAVAQAFKLRRIPTHTTREKRNGEQEGVNYVFVTSEKFSQLVEEGEMMTWVKISDTQSSGPSKTEFTREPEGVTDVTPEIGLTIRKFIRSRGGKVLLVAVHAPLEERRKRIRAREPGISEEKVERLIQEDPVTEDKLKLANAHVDNSTPDERERAIQKTLALVGKFLGRG